MHEPSDFMRRFERKAPDDCWLWMGSLDKDGYGIYYYHGAIVRAQRFLCYFLWGANYFPPSFIVGTLCRNKRCMNPRHFIISTRSEVSKRIHEEQWKQGKHYARLTKDQIIAARKEFMGKRGDITRLARKYGTSVSTMNRIIHHKNCRGAK